MMMYDASMRTTVTLDPDVDARLRKLMREQGITFREAVNFAVRAGIPSAASAVPFSTPTFDLGGARVNLDKALQLAGQLEDEELMRKRDTGK